MKQTSYRVLCIIFAVIIIAVPVISYFINSYTFSDSAPDYGWYLEEAEWYEEMGDMGNAIRYRSQYEAYTGLNEMGVVERSPAYYCYGVDYVVLYTVHAAAAAFVSGDLTEDQFWYSVYDEYIRKYHAYVDKSAEEPDTFADPEAWEEYNEEYWEIPFNIENVKKSVPVFENEIASLKTKLETFDLKAYYTEQAENASEAVQYAEDYVKETEAAAKADSKDYELAYAFESAKLSLEGARFAEKAAKLLADKCWEYGGWQQETIERVIKRSAVELGDLAVMSEERYKERCGDFMLEERYKEYKKNIESEQKMFRDAITLGFYSIEHDIPMPGTLPDGSVKSAIRDQLGTIVTITSLIMIVLAGSTLSNEYSTGTIRLLLIRPRKRAKILGSKIVSMVFLWIMAILLALILSAGIDILLLGMGDAFVPDLDIAKNGNVTVTPAFVGGLEVLGGNLLSSAVLVFLALLLSTLVRRAALSIALPIIVQTLIGLGQTVLLALIPAVEELHFLVYTPLPYSDLSVFRTVNAAEQLIGNGSGSLIAELFGMQIPEGFHPVLGAAYLAGFTILFIVLSFVSFTKQQIKN